MDIERQNFLNEFEKEKQKDFTSKSIEQQLRNRLDIIKQELKNNGGKVPQHRIDEERKKGLI